MIDNLNKDIIDYGKKILKQIGAIDINDKLTLKGEIMT